jgi:hypothetical protein
LLAIFSLSFPIEAQAQNMAGVISYLRRRSNIARGPDLFRD